MPPTVHMIVEKGPDQGREIAIPAPSARIGRSSNNDIVLKDPAMSRFHCRFFFKPGEGLWAEDLGSANQTLLNDQPLFEARVRVDDRLTMGDTTLKVLSEDLTPPDAPAAPVEMTSPAEEKPAADKASFSATRPIDKLFEAPENVKLPANIRFLRSPMGQSNRQHRIKMLLVVMAAAGAVAVAGVLFSRSFQRPVPAAIPVAEPRPYALEIEYEKVQANSNNIFRYHLTLKSNQLSIQIDDLKNRRHVPGNQLKPLDPELVQSLADTLRHSGFDDLKDEYKGLATDVWDVWDLTVTLGKNVRRVRVLNSLEPDAFKTTREAVEVFGQNELGLTALALTPEKLLDLARQAFLLGQSLYDQRNIKNENLAMAIRSLKEAEWYLETIEPKPDFYADAVSLRGHSEREIQDIYNNHLFLAERAIKLRDWAEAATQYRQICDKVPDRSDERHSAARKKLIDVERRLKRK